jgi:hypothetical protein
MALCLCNQLAIVSIYSSIMLMDLSSSYTHPIINMGLPSCPLHRIHNSSREKKNPLPSKVDLARLLVGTSSSSLPYFLDNTSLPVS